MASLAMTSALSVTSVAAVSFQSAASNSRLTARPSAAPSKSCRLVIRSAKGGGAEKQPGDRLNELKDGAQDLLNKAKNAIGDQQDVTPAGEFRGRMTGKGGEVRAVTNANKEDAGDRVAGAVENVKEGVEDAVKAVKNAFGGDEGGDSVQQKGAFTTPNREKMKAKYNPDVRQ
eukprot:jgi/Mesen1/5906/ME000030S05169